MQCGLRIQVKVILAVMKQLKQLHRKPRNNSEAPMGFTCLQQGFIAQLVVSLKSWVQIPLKPQNFPGISLQLLK